MHITLLLLALFSITSIAGDATVPVDTGRTIYNRTLANKISEKVRLMCSVLTSPQNHYTRAIHIKNTWGKRCNIILFISTSEDPKLPTIALSGKEGDTWTIVRDSFKYIYKHYFDDIDWVLKVDDDTYVIIENLKFLLYPYSPNKPLYFGNQLKTTVSVASDASEDFREIQAMYMFGGAGYVLSKEALRRFTEIAFHNPILCNHGSTTSKLEDVEMGICMKALNVTGVDSRDHQGRERFVGVPLQALVLPKLQHGYDGYWNARVYNASMGIQGISINPISFHGSKPTEMYFFEFLLYHLRPFGVNTVSQLNFKIKESMTLENATKKAGN